MKLKFIIDKEYDKNLLKIKKYYDILICNINYRWNF